jgi:uncharacterized protein YndB with AHSA1/START domain
MLGPWAIGIGLLAQSGGLAGGEEPAPRILRKEVVVRAPLEQVWRCWTTEEGLGFVSGKSNVKLEIGGPYEWFLDGPADERGRRGGEGARVLAFLPREMLAFSWTFPPAVPELRLNDETTQVVLLFDDLGDGRVRLRFAQHGWGTGEAWDAGWDYFDRAWSYVLERLRAHLEDAD